jgi:RNA polymerase sigma factor for flagellar operon FliA
MGCTSREEKETLLNYLANNDGENALALTTIKEVKATLARHIEALPEKERLVVSMYYSDEMTMKEIGLALEITESRVSQIHSQAVLRLRNKLRKDGLLEE